MTITYPLTPPTDIAKAIRFSPVAVVAQNTSPFTLEQEVFEHMGQMWRVTVQVPPLEKDQGEKWASFFLALNGIQGTFLLGDPVGQTPRGTPTGTPVVDGAGQQRSKVLNTRGWTPNTEIFKAGDYIQLDGYRLHKVLVDTTSDGAGDAALDIFPRIRDELLDGTTIITENTVGIFRLEENIPSYEVAEAVLYGINFNCREAL